PRGLVFICPSLDRLLADSNTSRSLFGESVTVDALAPCRSRVLPWCWLGAGTHSSREVGQTLSTSVEKTSMEPSARTRAARIAAVSTVMAVGPGTTEGRTAV